MDSYDLGIMAYPSFWIYPTVLANKYGIPIIWSSVGIQSNLKNEFKEIAKAVFKQIDYLSVRDTFSKSITNQLGVECSLLPDTAISISNIFSKNSLRQTYLDFLYANDIINNKIAVFHLKKRYLDCEIKQIIHNIKSIAQALKVIPVLIPLGQCHEDEYLLEEIKLINSDLKLILKNYSLKLILSLLAHSEFYCGSSLHGYISAMSYNVKGVIIADEKTINFRKFSGFLEFFNQESKLISSWRNKSEIVDKLKQNHDLDRKRTDILTQSHWEKINKLITNHNNISYSKPSLEQFQLVNTITNFYK